jgi:hypothetical protein
MNEAALGRFGDKRREDLEIGLGRYDQVFAANEIDFDVIRSLTDADLR